VPKAHVNGIDLFYEAEGEGEPVLLLAGFGCDHTAWSLATPPLAAHHRVIRLDNRGSGRSDAPDSPTSIRQMADDVTALLDHLGLDRVHVAGHSMGGQVAQELALAHPGRVRSLTLLSTWARPDRRLRSLTESWGELPRTLDPRSYIRVILPWVFTEAFFETTGAVEGVVALWVTPPFPPAPHALYHQSRAVMGSDTSGRAGDIRCPTLVLVGRQDILTPVRFSEELVRLIPGSRLAVLDRGGHNCLIEAPEAVAGAMLDFLNGWSPTPERH
jgi:pimeloyl-ACP methyl ester carboxylesterase